MNGEHPNTPAPLSTDQRVNTRLKLDFDQRARAVKLEDYVSDDEYATAAEIIFLRDVKAELLASLKEMGDWIAAGLQASDEAWPDERCMKHTEEIAARARAAVDKAEGRS